MSDKKSGGINPIVAAVTGAVVGGIAVAGAMTLSDEKKREQVKDALMGAKDKATGFVQDAKEKALDTKDAVGQKISDAKEMAMDKADDIQDAFHHASEDLKDAV